MKKKITTVVDAWQQYIRVLLKTSRVFAGAMIATPDTPADHEAAKAVAFKFVHAVRALRSISVLVDAGDPTGAYILTRSSFEHLVDSAVFVHRPAEVWRFLEEAAELEAKIQRAIDAYGPPASEIPEAMKRRPSAEDLRDRFGARAAEESKCKAWKKLNTRAKAELAQRPDLVELYDMFYPLASAYAHGASTIVLDYLRTMGESKTEFRIDQEPLPSDLAGALSIGASVFLEHLALLEWVFRPGLRTRLRELHQQRIELMIQTMGLMSRRWGGPWSPSAA